MLPRQYVEIPTYISNKLFRFKQEEAKSDLKDVQAGVGLPQGSVLGPVLYVLFTSNISNLEQAKLATFADDTTLLTTGQDVVISTRLLQKASNTIHEWTKKWKIKHNEDKSAHINFTNKRLNSLPPLVINGTVAINENKACSCNSTLYSILLSSTCPSINFC